MNARTAIFNLLEAFRGASRGGCLDACGDGGVLWWKAVEGANAFLAHPNDNPAEEEGVIWNLLGAINKAEEGGWRYDPDGSFAKAAKDAREFNDERALDRDLRAHRSVLWALRRGIHAVTSHDWRMRRVEGYHRSSQVQIDLGEVSATVDRNMTKVLLGFHGRGLPTQWSCQGASTLDVILRHSLLSGLPNQSHNQHACLILQPGHRFPDTLIGVARRANFEVQCDGRWINVRGGSVAFLGRTNRAFLAMLADFLEDGLDQSGQRYRRGGPHRVRALRCMGVLRPG